MHAYAQAGKELAGHKSKWQTLADFESESESWLTGSCRALDPDQIQAKVDDFTKANYRAAKAAASAGKEDAVVKRLKDALDSFKEYLPLLAEVANQALVGAPHAHVHASCVGQRQHCAGYDKQRKATPLRLCPGNVMAACMLGGPGP